jgi:hypothetical protein
MNQISGSEFTNRQEELCKEHGLLLYSVPPTDQSFPPLMTRFSDGALEVDLVASSRDEEGRLSTLCLHTNGSGNAILAHDSSAGRRYHFPLSWLEPRKATFTTEVEVNAWSRFSSTPTGRQTGYKQQRFSRTPKLFFRGARIVRINDGEVNSHHAGKVLYQALKDHPAGVRLTLESR